MCAVNICIGHDDDALIAQQIRIAVLAAATAQSEDQVGDFAVCTNLVCRGRGDVQNLAPDWQNSLCLAIARLLRRTPCTVTLDNEQLGSSWVIRRTISEFAREAAAALR